MRYRSFLILTIYVLFSGCSDDSSLHTKKLDYTVHQIGYEIGKDSSYLDRVIKFLKFRPDQKQPNLQTVEVFFGTDRETTDSPEADTYYGGKQGPFQYGFCEVTIPIDVHVRGELERPSLLSLEYEEDPSKHVILKKINVQDYKNFIDSLSFRINKSPNSQALVFVHGFNVAFADAARRTAQLAYDLQFQGTPIFYSWPSLGSAKDYGGDRATIELAEVSLSGFLDKIFDDTQVKELYLIAHSMGNEALTRAFIDVSSKRADGRQRVKELILVAPDIDARVFKTILAPKLAASGAGITLYASADDRALKASKLAHSDYPRAGDISDGVTIVDGVETIDATGTDTSLTKHSYFVTHDMFYLIDKHLRANDRYLETIRVGDKNYWKIPKEKIGG